MANLAEAFMGALLVISFIVCMLYGITVLQAFIYFQTYPNDDKLLKFLVIWVLILETSHTAFVITIVYYFLVANFGNARVWGLTWTLGVVTLFQVLIASTVQSIYVRRIWIISGKARLLTIILSFIVFSRFAVGLAAASCILAITTRSNVKTRNWLLPIVILTSSLGAFTDLTIATVFSFYMLRGHSHYSRASRTLMNVLTLYAIHTGAANAAASISIMIVYISVRTTLASIGIGELGAKLYANAFIGSLNSRAYLRDKTLNRAYSCFGPTITLSDVEFATSPSDFHATPGPERSVILVQDGGSSITCEGSSSTACEPPRTPGRDGAPGEDCI